MHARVDINDNECYMYEASAFIEKYKNKRGIEKSKRDEYQPFSRLKIFVLLFS